MGPRPASFLAHRRAGTISTVLRKFGGGALPHVARGAPALSAPPPMAGPLAIDRVARHDERCHLAAAGRCKYDRGLRYRRPRDVLLGSVLRFANTVGSFMPTMYLDREPQFDRDQRSRRCQERDRYSPNATRQPSRGQAAIPLNVTIPENLALLRHGLGR